MYGATVPARTPQLTSVYGYRRLCWGKANTVVTFHRASGRFGVLLVPKPINICTIRFVCLVSY